MVSPNRAQEDQFPNLARQGSLYNLTFDQLGHVGKPLNAMKLDELLKNVISLEEGQLLHNVNHSSSSSSSSSVSASVPFFLGNFDLNGRLTEKTVDEDVWKDIVHQEHVNAKEKESRIQQQIGETTLEDFLVRTGVINIENQNALNPQPIMAIDPMVVVSQQADWLQLQMAAVQRQQQQQMTVLDSNFHVSEPSVFENPVIDVGYSENQLGMTMQAPAMSATSSESQAAAEKNRRYSNEMMEKTIERRQKRMIKNRESAARSRARKQAYTNKLEHEVFHLRKANAWLKKLKEVEMLLSTDSTPFPRYQLRRTSSAPF
ncbi:hypothetical protein GH714_001955 [Hevea brasiliensis]|uniref:BZIP domain-containing protein n=1 Tax=Hevea brasiliensis TaxID=3981 RepID=A0A6A6L9S3_HEVBR|nr:hypothetical protein GH714_001955 [Hevea brasiliensis]